MGRDQRSSSDSGRGPSPDARRGARGALRARSLSGLALWMGLLGAALSALAPAAPGLPGLSAVQSGSAGSGGAAAEPEGLKVFLSSALAKFGEPVAIVLRVEGDRRIRFGPIPTLDGLRIEEPTRAGTRTSVARDSSGRYVRESTTDYQIVIRPERLGVFELPPLDVEVDGVRMKLPAGDRLSLEVVKDIEASQLLMFERSDLPERVYEGQPYEIDFRFGWDQERRSADIELQLPWWNNQDGVIQVEASAARRGRYEVPIRPGRETAPVEELGSMTRNGRKFQLFRLRQRFVATRSGSLEFGRSVFKFSEVVGRSGGMFSRGEVRTYYAPLEAFNIEVLPVPEAGRPVEWSGAVGAFRASRDAKRRDIDLGDTIKFEVRYEGDGNLEFFDAPDLSRVPAFDRFRVLGVEDDKAPGSRTLRYDLVPMDADLTEIPPVPLPVFDTDKGAYVTLETSPLPIRVTGADDGGVDPFGDGEEAAAPIALRDIQARPRTASWTADGPGAGAALTALILVGASLLVLGRAVRRHGDPASAEERRRRRAMGELERGLRSAKTPDERGEALEEFLAARTGTHAAAWVGRAELVDLEVGDELTAEYVALHRGLARARFGGGDEVPSDQILGFARRVQEGGL